MRPLTKLTAGIFVVLMAGAGTAAVTLSQGPAEQAPFHIPSMNHGDTITFDTTFLQDDGAWSTPYPSTFVIGAEEEVVDWRGRLVPAVRIAPQSGAADSQDSAIVEWVDLEQRLVIQRRTTYESEAFDRTSVSYQRAIPLLPAVALQDTTWAIGEGGSVPVRLDPMYTSGGGGGGGAASVLGLTTIGRQNTDTGAHPQLQAPLPRTADVTVVDVSGTNSTRTLTLRWVETEEHPRRLSETPDGTQALPGFEQTREYVATFAAGVAVPTVIERHTRTLSDEGETNEARSILRLTSYVPGTTPVAWGTTAPPPPQWQMETTNGLHPADGGESLVPYPLSRAIEDVATYGFDPEWLAWTAQNPSATLIAATMSKGALSWTGESSFEWRLVYATHGSVFEVRTERVEGAPLPIVEAMGETEAPIEVLLSEPAPLLTIADAERLWRKATARGDTEAPTYVHWGARATTWASSDLCIIGVWSSDGNGLSPYDQIRTVQIGHTPHGPCYTQESTTHFEALSVHAGAPAVIGYHSSDIAWF